ncbi:hypothetical protein [Streptomyces sp. BR123]|uniref:hypothetical protein n=1 Tax=Streptomyces sp. BR123 TaxID=2749828 RepID=UPI00211B5267|nr:hypothetical protein [Streptomyces sp. BR123]
MLVADKHRHGLRDAHAKSHGVLAGELRIHSDLPSHLTQRLFAEPATYPVIVRFSSAPGDLRSDQVPVQRGIAIKVVGAPGPRALDDGRTTQDFLLVNHPTLPFGNIAEYAKLQDLLDKQPRQSDQQLQLTGLAARAAAKASPVWDARCHRPWRPWPPPTTTSLARRSTPWPRCATATTAPTSRPRRAPRTCGP